ncbi:hypothetical protein C8R46DRAFT_1031027 [Mycena filopes]|nr:hypothetical protein C8R46DRAFT_1034150 [Mycena filopes]KAJ7174334.1 hypothetical protein C8R46DRAFT_1031027 [Mycena filopes]
MTKFDAFAKSHYNRENWPTLPSSPNYFSDPRGADMLLSLSPGAGTCGRCRSSHIACSFFRNRQSCPVCIVKSVSGCSWTFRDGFVALLRTHRDSELKLIEDPVLRVAFLSQFYADCSLAFMLFDCGSSTPEFIIASGYSAVINSITDQINDIANFDHFDEVSILPRDLHGNISFASYVGIIGSTRFGQVHH